MAEGISLKKRIWLTAGIFTAIVAIVLYIFFVPAPAFPSGKVFEISKGESLSQIASNLRLSGYIRSRSLFKLAVILEGRAESLRSGDYFFEEPLSLFEIASRITHGISGIQTVRVTIPEGFNLFQTADLLDKLHVATSSALFSEVGVPGLDYRKDKFSLRPADFSNASKLLASKPAYVSLEGYIFPDTYFIQINDSPHLLIEKALQNFDKKISADIQGEIRKQGKTLHEILTMASLLEEEASNDEDRKIISGILWKRISIGMFLQVDPTVRYSVGKPDGPLSDRDYAVNSPYNTYKHPGLPIGPISSPGLEAIVAAIHPQASPYLYYMSGTDGTVHYAKTFEEHKLNKERYLR